MAINKVVYGNSTLIDLMEDTVSADKLLAGETAHDRSGASIEGTVVTTEIWTGTQAEYEAQASQITDGTVVQITDDEKAITFIEAEEIYSTDERMVGVWINGKPLYQRTYLLNLSMPTAGSWYNTSVSMEGVERIVFAIGNGESGDTLDIQASITNSLLYILRVAGRGSSYLTQVTIQYTKTTDVAGSGEYVPSGDKAEHYSTDEEVIGTFFGETLYRKVITSTENLNMNANTWTKTNIPKGSINRVINGRIIVVYDGTYSLHFVQFAFLDDMLTVNCFRNLSISIGSMIILEYTKTTD